LGNLSSTDERTDDSTKVPLQLQLIWNSGDTMIAFISRSGFLNYYPGKKKGRGINRIGYFQFEHLS
jgi:hypothetical protein